MTLKSFLSSTKNILTELTKASLIELLLQLQKEIKNLEKENNELKEQLKKQKLGDVNKEANKPSGKQAEWEKVPAKKSDSNKDSKRKPSRKRKARKGSGNRIKKRKPTKIERAKVDKCGTCGKYLKNKPVLDSSNEHTVEDIPEPCEKTNIIKIEKEKKYCGGCQKVTTAKSERALPGADIGLNATVLICYLWTALCLPYTKIMDYLDSFYGLKLSTSGLSKHVIMVSKAMEAVHQEILEDIQIGATLFADETGWRVKGKNWWLWVFGTATSAYFTLDKSRGSNVVRRVLGEVFLGVLVVDGWSA